MSEERLGARDARHLRVLDELERTANVSQRALAEGLGLTASGVNRLIGELTAAGRVEVVDRTVRPFAYRLTDAGRRYRQRLSHRHYRQVMGGFRELRARIQRRLAELEVGGGERVLLVGTGSAARALLADGALGRGDAEVEGLYKLFHSGWTDPMNVGNPNGFTILELAEAVLEEVPTSSEIVHRPLPEDDPKVRRPDISLAREILGWEPGMSLRQGLRKTVPYFRQRVEEEDAEALVL